MRLTPLHAQVLIAPIKQGEVSRGGLLIPDVAINKSPFAYGDVIAVGTGRTNAEGKTVPLVVQEGQVVQYARNAGIDVPVEDEKGERVMRLIEERYIFCIVHGLPRATGLTDLDGRLIGMMPASHARADLAYENMENAKISIREGWAGPSDFVDDEVPFEPKD